MANYYLDFVGLNTFIYEPVGYDPENQIADSKTSREANATAAGQLFAVELNTFSAEPVIHEIQKGQLQYYKNRHFSHNLPTTASFFPALMLKRNGPYGYPTWKQIRLSENPLSRKQRKENIFTFVTEPGDEVVVNNNEKISTITNKYGAIQKFIENPLASRYKPFVVGGASIVDNGTLERFELFASYGNETIFFNNEEINKYNNLRMIRSRQYETVKDFYLNGGLNSDVSPIDSFEFFRYRECVYPSRVYQYKNYVRQRTTFSFPWRDNRQDRIEVVNDNGFEAPTSLAIYENITQSVWPLDACSAFETHSLYSGFSNLSLGLHNLGGGATDSVDMGILQNQYSFGTNGLPSKSAFGTIDQHLAVAPLYNRKHTLRSSSSVVSPNGMNIEGINSGLTMGNMSVTTIGFGEAKWEAGSQSGLNPFYDTYDNYIQDVRQYGKDYSIIPEFRISEHVETYQSKGLTEEIPDLFSLTGALSNTTDSSKTDFYKIYSTSDFMKHFEIVKNDHNDFVPANSISLKCKAVKKFLPYEGFYPAQRSVDLAKQFYNSYKDFAAVSGASNAYGTSSASPYLFQNLMVPTFAPGIFFNTIKSGVAVDYPLIDSNVTIANNYVSKSSGDDYFLVNDFADLWDRRIPFEAIVEPEKHLAGFQIFCNEPHKFANNSGSVMWDGNGDNLYKLMAQNFMAEVPDFFMKSKSFTSISSKPSSDPNVGRAEAGKTYMMRIKMYKSKDTANLPKVSASSGVFETPQYDFGSKETFTMYSRPTAFGPPQEMPGYSNLSSNGENYSFTPPYYYGQAFCDVTFTATESKKYSIQEMINSSSIRQWRYTKYEDFTDQLKTTGINGIYLQQTNPSKELAMQLNASVNIFSQTDFVAEQSSRGGGFVIPNSSDNPSRWVIQTKFETPMLNFNHLSASDSITLPNNASQSVPRGMWHQYGRIEENPEKGVFLQITDVPKDWIDHHLGKNSATTGSLVDLCGFSTEAKRLGEIANQKKVYEAVVAIPFIEEEGQRKFFRIPRIDIERAFGNAADRSLVGDSVLKMITKMQRYVFPPTIDFIENETVDPFAMYIFEFSHVFKKQDLANMWQNLYPKIGQTFETAESSISHELLAHELLGGGAKLNPEGTLDVNAIGNEIPDRVRWMIFKVKQKAETNYFKKIIERKNDNIFQEGEMQITYNWPYDFFSLVELAKIESEVKFAERAIKTGQEPRSNIKPKTRESIIASTENNSKPEYALPETPGLDAIRLTEPVVSSTGLAAVGPTYTKEKEVIIKKHKHQKSGASAIHEHEVEIDEDGNVVQHENQTHGTVTKTYD